MQSVIPVLGFSFILNELNLFQSLDADFPLYYLFTPLFFLIYQKSDLKLFENQSKSFLSLFISLFLMLILSNHSSSHHILNQVCLSFLFFYALKCACTFKLKLISNLVGILGLIILSLLFEFQFLVLASFIFVGFWVLNFNFFSKEKAFYLIFSVSVGIASYFFSYLDERRICGDELETDYAYRSSDKEKSYWKKLVHSLDDPLNVVKFKNPIDYSFQYKKCAKIKKTFIFSNQAFREMGFLENDISSLIFRSEKVNKGFKKVLLHHPGDNLTLNYLLLKTDAEIFSKGYFEKTADLNSKINNFELNPKAIERVFLQDNKGKYDLIYIKSAINSIEKKSPFLSSYFPKDVMGAELKIKENFYKLKENGILYVTTPYSYSFLKSSVPSRVDVTHKIFKISAPYSQGYLFFPNLKKSELIEEIEKYCAAGFCYIGEVTRKNVGQKLRLKKLWSSKESIIRVAQRELNYKGKNIYEKNKYHFHLLDGLLLVYFICFFFFARKRTFERKFVSCSSFIAILIFSFLVFLFSFRENNVLTYLFVLIPLSFSMSLRYFCKYYYISVSSLLLFISSQFYYS